MSVNSDIVVVGGGMVGALAAAAFARCGLDVVLLEQRPPQSFNELHYDLRVSALSEASQKMLGAIGAWDGISAMRKCPYQRMLVWDSETTARTLFDSSRIGKTQLGHIVENSVIQIALWQHLKNMNNVTIDCPSVIQSLQPGRDHVEIQTDNNEYTASLLIAADGASSTVREMAEIAVEGSSYDQHALVAAVNTEYAQQDITWQRFTPSGPQAFLPLVGQRASIVWYESPENVQRLKQLDDKDFIREMTESFPEELGKLESVIARGSFPLHWQHAQKYVLPRVALVGDAAHSVHPLAGQGVNMGFMDVGALVDCVVDSYHAGKDIGSFRYLRRYERWRRPANEVMIRFLDGIQQAFQPESSREWLFKQVRTMALKSAEQLSPVNELCMKTAMGLTGDLPHLAYGRLPAYK